MGELLNSRRTPPGQWSCRWAGVALGCLGLCGCAGFWDDITSNTFKVANLISKPDVMVVLRDSKDGDQRAWALRSLKEPKENGGTDQDQDTVLHILAAAATTESQPLCRLAAIESLGRFKDPRATQALKDAFYNAGTFGQNSRPITPVSAGVYNFSGPAPDIVTRIQCQALEALGQTGNPDCMDLLVRVVREPRGEGEQENQQAMDRRISAARALAKFNNPQASQALVDVLDKEKDVALRDRAYESLQASTGKDLPPDPKAWNAMLHPDQQPNNPQLAEEKTKPTLLPASFRWPW